MTEISTNYQGTNEVNSSNTQVYDENITKKQQYQRATKPRMSHDEFWSKEKKKNTGLIERLYNKIKNATGLGIGSKKVEIALNKVKNGEISKAEFKKTVKEYNSSQETSAQVFGDLLSVGAAGLTYFGVRNEAKLHYAGKQLNEKFGVKDFVEELAETTRAGGLNLRTIKKLYGKILARAATSKTKLAVFTTGLAALMGGTVKLQALQLNRIGSQEFKTDKKDYNGAKNEYDKAAYKIKKKMNSMAKFNSNLRNFASGTINGLLMPISVVGGAIAGIPAYFAGNSLNRYFIGQRHNEKSINGYTENLVNDGVTHIALGAATLIPMAKKGRFSSVFDKNLEAAFKEINAHDVLKDNPYGSKTTYQQLNDIMFESPEVNKILKRIGKKEGETLSRDEQIMALSDENIFAVKLKQIQENDPLAKALQENCPSTRTLEEASKEIKEKLGKGYKVKVNMGTGTIAETYLVEAPDGKEVCVKMLKKGINAEKIERDEQKFINLVKSMKDKTEAEKTYLIKNIEDLANGVSKEIDFENEMKAAQKLVEYTKTANVVKPIEVKNGLYVMQKAEGISFRKLLELNNLDYFIKDAEKELKEAKNAKDKEGIQRWLDELKKEKAAMSSKYKDIVLTEKDVDYMIDEYMKVLVEQLYKIDKSGRTLHADIHPGNIFIDVNAIKARKGKAFTLIDTGNTIDLTAEQAERSMKLTQYLEHGDTKDLAKYFIEDANLAESGLSKEEATKKVEEELNKVFFSTDIRLNTMNNNEIITLTSNIMKNMKIMPGDSQLNLEKARTSADKSYRTLLNIWFNEASRNVTNKKGSTTQVLSAFGMLGKALSKINEYKELQQAQERENLWQMIKSPKKFFESQNNPNYLKKNSKEYLIYHLKQDIKTENMIKHAE